MDEATRALMFSSAATEYQTPDHIFNPVRDKLGLQWDVAASHENHRLPTYCTPEGSFIKHFTTPHKGNDAHGLDPRAWVGHRVWCNPPYGKGIEDWVKAAALNGAEVAALLLPARTDTSWFHRWVAPYAEVHFIMGRVAFWGHLDACYVTVSEWGGGRQETRGEPDHPPHQLPSAPFPSIIAVYKAGLHVPNGALWAYTWDPRSDETFTHG